MMKFRSLALSALAVLAAGTASARITTVDFESVPGAMTGSTNNHVADGYADLAWSDSAYVLNSSVHPDTGYEYGAIGDWVLYSANAYPLSFSSLSLAQNFDFKGAYIAAAWRNESVTVKGFDDGVEKYSILIDATNAPDALPELFAFNFLGIDTVTFSGYSSHIVLDNLQIRFAAAPTPAVPEPHSLALSLVGLGLMGAVARRRTRQR